MSKHFPRTEKISDLLKRVKMCVESGNFKFTGHALKRRLERLLSLPDIIYVLKNGHHESSKDSWDEQYETWNYAIRGKTVDQDSIRIIISFDTQRMLIITVIRINKKS